MNSLNDALDTLKLVSDNTVKNLRHMKAALTAVNRNDEAFYINQAHRLQVTVSAMIEQAINAVPAKLDPKAQHCLPCLNGQHDKCKTFNPGGGASVPIVFICNCPCVDGQLPEQAITYFEQGRG
jgi:hypothetical protein